MELNNQLMNSYAFAQAALDAVSANVCILDSNGFIIAVNQGWRDFFEQNSVEKTSQSVGVNYFDICNNATGSRSEEALPMLNGILQVMKGEIKEFTLDYPCHSPTEERWFRARVTKFSDGSGNVIIAHELITERKLAIDALRLSEARMKAILNNVAKSFLFIDLNGKIQFFNKLAEERALSIFKLAIQVGDILIDKINDDNKYIFESNFKQAIKGQIIELEKTFIVNNKPHWFEIKYIPVETETKEIIGVLFTTRDIDKYKRNEKKLLEYSENLEKLNATKDKFFNIIAHDLRNPFTGILGVSDILKEKINNLGLANVEEINHIINLLVNSAKSASALLENLLQWAKAQTGTLEIDLKPMSIAEEIKSIIELTQGNAYKKNISIKLELSNTSLVIADSKLTNTILRNLITNAIKFTKIGGIITIFTKKKDEFLEISIQDTGVGISKDHLSMLFRIDSKLTKNGTANEKGSGLGLIICKEFSVLQGGSLNVESKIGEGSIFTLSLPIAEN